MSCSAKVARRSASETHTATREGVSTFYNMFRCTTRVQPNIRAFTPGTDIALQVVMNDRSARHVYVLQSIVDSSRTYVGLSSDVQGRLATHNSGGSRFTAPHRPWQLVASIEFADPNRAKHFERYLKSGSGRAFTKRHLL